MREGDLEGSGGLVGHEGPGLLSAGEGGRMVESAKHDVTSTGGDIEGLAPRVSSPRSLPDPVGGFLISCG